MNVKTLAGMLSCINHNMQDQKNYLVSLDQKFGDGDLGISMAAGFGAVDKFMQKCDEKDLGKVLMKCALVFNETSPSSLGTIISLGFMGMAKSLLGKEEASLAEIAQAMEKGIEKIMEKAKSKPGEKTILDAICPAVITLKAYNDTDEVAAFKAAAEAATAGCESTKQMISVHGRAAYYGAKSLGSVDGGSVVGKIIATSIYEYLNRLRAK